MRCPASACCRSALLPVRYCKAILLLARFYIIPQKMPGKIKHIILVCTDMQEAARFQLLLRDIHSPAHVTVADTTAGLFALLRKNRPAILVLRPDDTCGGSTVLMEIRKHQRFDKIPIVVFPLAPDKNSICELFITLRNTIPDFRT